MPKLTPALLSSLSKEDPKNATVLNLSKQSISHIDDISHCICLKKLDLSENRIDDSESLSGLGYLKTVTWLNLAGNGLTGVDYIWEMRALRVLNLSHNEIKVLPSKLSQFSDLQALILSHNKIECLDASVMPVSLNTLVLAHNSLKDMPSLKHCKSLSKLSLSHNQLHNLPDLDKLPILKELRLNDNRLMSLGRIPLTLTVLDIGNNPLDRLEVLPQRLQNLNILGTKIKIDEIKGLKVFNGKSVQGRKKRPFHPKKK